MVSIIHCKNIVVIYFVVDIYEEITNRFPSQLINFIYI